jgi:SmpA / OmlA family
MQRASCFLFLLLAVACGNPLPELTGLDVDAWKNDRNGCGGTRAGSISTLLAQKNKLQGLSEMQIIQLLGRPDQQELYKRHQKFYYYQLQPGKPCGSVTDGKRLSVRFNATGASKEIAIE